MAGKLMVNNLGGGAVLVVERQGEVNTLTGGHCEAANWLGERSPEKGRTMETFIMLPSNFPSTP
jgi:hypothetical protein